MNSSKKFYGVVGYVDTVETRPNIYEEIAVERSYFGDVLRNVKRSEGSEHLNDNINVNNLISIVADEYAYDHFFAIRYVVWQNSKWKVTNVEVSRPRLILTIGGVYNGEKTKIEASYPNEGGGL